MSIFNEELVQKMIEIARPTKIAQQTQQAIDPNMVKSIAAKMINNLENASTISTDKVDAALYTKDLQNLDSLISFLRLENIKYESKPIVVDNFNTLSDEDKKLYVAYKSQSGLDALPMTLTVGVYKEGLINYLQSLKQKVTGPQAGLVNTMVDKIVNEANTKLALGITSEQLGQGAQQAAQITDETVLDSINIPLDPNSPLTTPRDAGNIKIKAQYLKSKAAFDDFAQHLTLMKDGKVVEYSNFTEAAYCDILSALYARAKSYAYRRGGALDNAYLKLVEDLGSQYQCPLTEPTASSGQNKGVNEMVSYKGTSGSGPQVKGTPTATAASLAEKMPLMGDRVDLPRIVEWLRVYSRINKSPIASTAINNALQTAQYIMNTYRIDSQPLADEATAIASNLITTMQGQPQQKVSAPAAYLQQLRKLINLVGTVVSSFKNYYYDALPTQAMKDEINNQIGGGGSSFYNINIDAINSWLSDLPSALKTLQNTGF